MYIDHFTRKSNQGTASNLDVRYIHLRFSSQAYSNATSKGFYYPWDWQLDTSKDNIQHKLPGTNGRSIATFDFTFIQRLILFT